MRAFKGPDGQEDMAYLLQVDPVTTSRSVKFAMLADHSPMDSEFSTLISVLKTELLKLAQAGDDYDCVLLPGPTALALEAALHAFPPERRKKTLVVCNGRDGENAAQLLEDMGRSILRLSYKETSQPRASDVAKALDEDRTITHVWLPHVETSTGMLNPLEEIAVAVTSRARIMMLDATATLGAVPLALQHTGIDVAVGTASSALQSVPGLSFVLFRKSLLQSSSAQGRSSLLDLYGQWTAQQHGHFAQTPPTHAAMALREALRELAEEGGVQGRCKRIEQNADTLRQRLRAMGFTLLLGDPEASPVTQTVLAPRAATFGFDRFYAALRDRGFAIQPGNLEQRPSFRIGCIGPVDEAVMQQLVVSIEQVLDAMDVRNLAPGEP